MGTPPPPKLPHVLIVDRHEPSRIGLALILRRAEGIGECFVAPDAERALEIAGRRQPAVAVVDASNGAAPIPPLAAALRDAAPGIRLVLTSRCATAPPPAAATLSAAGFIAAGSSGEEAAAVVRRAVAAGTRIEPGERRTAGLTLREREVLALLAAGATNREIAAAVHLGPDAVKKNVSSILRKLGARNRTEASAFAREALLV